MSTAATTTAQRGPYAPFADKVMARINGQRDAQKLLQIIRQGCAPEDALLDAIRTVQATGDDERVRGFAREWQKLAERTAS